MNYQQMYVGDISACTKQWSGNQMEPTSPLYVLHITTRHSTKRDLGPSTRRCMHLGRWPVRDKVPTVLASVACPHVGGHLPVLLHSSMLDRHVCRLVLSTGGKPILVGPVAETDLGLPAGRCMQAG